MKSVSVQGSVLISFLLYAAVVYLPSTHVGCPQSGDSGHAAALLVKICTETE
jgi:hypothetical protein